MSNNPFKILQQGDFKWELYKTLCGSVAYRFYDKDVEIHQNNTFYPSVDDDKIMLKELVRMIVNEEKYVLENPKEDKFVHSERFNKLKEILTTL